MVLFIISCLIVAGPWILLTARTADFAAVDFKGIRGVARSLIDWDVLLLGVTGTGAAYVFRQRALTMLGAAECFLGDLSAATIQPFVFFVAALFNVPSIRKYYCRFLCERIAPSDWAYFGSFRAFCFEPLEGSTRLWEKLRHPYAAAPSGQPKSGPRATGTGVTPSHLAVDKEAPLVESMRIERWRSSYDDWKTHFDAENPESRQRIWYEATRDALVLMVLFLPMIAAGCSFTMPSYQTWHYSSASLLCWGVAKAHVDYAVAYSFRVTRLAVEEQATRV